MYDIGRKGRLGAIVLGACVAAGLAYCTAGSNRDERTLEPASGLIAEHVDTPRVPQRGAAADEPETASTRHASAPRGRATANEAARRTIRFDRASDLYLLASAALSAKQFSEVLDGWLASNACLSAGPSRPALESMAAGLGERGTPVAAPRQDAARLVLARCRGFFDNDRSATHALRRQLKERLNSYPDHYVGGIHRGVPTIEQLQSIFAAGDWHSFSLLLPEMSREVEARLGLSADSKDAQLLGVAWIRSICEVGKDCSPTGLVAAIRCTDTGQCDSRQDDEWFAQQSKEDQARIMEFQHWLVTSFRSGDAQALLGKGRYGRARPRSARGLLLRPREGRGLAQAQLCISRRLRATDIRMPSPSPSVTIAVPP